MTERAPWERPVPSTKERGAEADNALTNEKVITERQTRPLKVRALAAAVDSAEGKGAVKQEKKAAEEEAKRSASFKLNDDMQNLLHNLKQARDNIGFWSTGPGGQLTQGVWGAPSKDLSAALDAIKSPVVLQALQEARKGSAAGATGFGALSERELNILTASIASLKQDQRSDQLAKNLNQVENHFRRFMAYNEGFDPEDPEVAYKFGLASGSTPPKNDKTTGEGEWVSDPTLRGVDATVNAMIKAGRSESQIKSWLDEVSPGLGGKTQNLQENINYWRSGKGDPTVTIEHKFVPKTGLSKVVGAAATTAPGAYFMSTADALTSGYLDELTGDQPLAEAAMRGAADEHGTATLLGQLTGGALQAGVGGGLAAKYGVKIPSLAADILQGAAYGSGSASPGGRLEGAVTGGVLAPVVGLGVRGLGKGSSAVLRGLKDPAAELMAKYKIPMTLGQVVGGGLKRWEDKASSWPILGGAITARRKEGHEEFNRALFDHALKPIGASTNGEIGQNGVALAHKAVGEAYKDALDGVVLQPDAAFMQSIRGAPYAGLAKVHGLGPELTEAVDDIFAKYIDPTTQTISGDALQAARQELRDLKRSYKDDRQYTRSIKPHLDDIEDAYMGLFERQHPENAAKYLQADQAYKNVHVLGEAVDFAPAASNGIVTPAKVRDKARQATRVFGGKRASQEGRRPFEELTQAGQAKLTTDYPDSGTAGRLLMPLLAASTLGGGRYVASGGEDGHGGAEPRDTQGAGLYALLGAAAAATPYSRRAQRALQASILGSRPQASQKLGDLLARYITPTAVRGLVPSVVGRYVPHTPNPQIAESPEVFPRGGSLRPLGTATAPPSDTSTQDLLEKYGIVVPGAVDFQ